MKKLFDVKIPALKGTKTIADSKLFNFIDSNFKNWGIDTLGKHIKKIGTFEQNLEVLEMDEEATFKDIFTNPEKMVLTQEQILWFVENHKDKLRKNWYGNFFLFKVNGECFVAVVDVFGDGQLRVAVVRFSGDGVWSSEVRLRVVVPQLTPSTP